MPKAIILITATLAILVCCYFLLRHAEDEKYKQAGARLIKKIETYRVLNNRLPNTIADIGLTEPMEQGPYYEKTDSLYYIVFFNIGFDETKTYYSQTQNWEDKP